MVCNPSILILLDLRSCLVLDVRQTDAAAAETVQITLLPQLWTTAQLSHHQLCSWRPDLTIPPAMEFLNGTGHILYLNILVANPNSLTNTHVQRQNRVCFPMQVSAGRRTQQEERQQCWRMTEATSAVIYGGKTLGLSTCSFHGSNWKLSCNLDGI